MLRPSGMLCSVSRFGAVLIFLLVEIVAGIVSVADVVKVN
jgi:hypothetical protein